MHRGANLVRLAKFVWGLHNVTQQHAKIQFPLVSPFARNFDHLLKCSWPPPPIRCYGRVGKTSYGDAQPAYKNVESVGSMSCLPSTKIPEK